jgi:hypothetical protein
METAKDRASKESSQEGWAGRQTGISYRQGIDLGQYRSFPVPLLASLAVSDI